MPPEEAAEGQEAAEDLAAVGQECQAELSAEPWQATKHPKTIPTCTTAKTVSANIGATPEPKSAFAGPAVSASHPFMEPTTRALIKFGDSWGGAGGALMMDPLGTVSSGKYSGGELALGALLGPFSKLVK